MFIDQATITVKAGDGGNGCVSFRREKYVPKGGPDGGTGGSGGDVTIRSDARLTTLMDFRYKRQYAAEDAEHGKGSRKTGRDGAGITLRVPAGTILKDARTGEVMADLAGDGEELCVARGGRGGRGNAEFATSTNQAPRYAEKGAAGEERMIELELKLLADVGLIGFPNAGKSTLISRISAARPRIADYPFTTLIPNLGIVRYGEFKSFAVADMPGLIEGAHKGKGLGIEFLRHIERTRVLVILIEATAEHPGKDYRTLINEIGSFKASLLKKPQIIAMTKLDLADDALRKKLSRLSIRKNVPLLLISSVTGEGLKKLLDMMWRKLLPTRELPVPRSRRR